MVQRWAGSHDLPRSDRTLGPQVLVLTTITHTMMMADKQQRATYGNDGQHMMTTQHTTMVDELWKLPVCL